MLKNRLLAALLAVLLAVVGIVLVVSYTTQAERRALEGIETTPVLVVQQLVPAGTPASELDGLVAVEQLPALAVASGAVADAADLGDRVATVDLLPGEQVLDARFGTADDTAAAPEGAQYLSIPVDAARAVGGRLVAGDRVGVYVTFTDDAAGTGPSSQLLLDGVPVSHVQGGVTISEEGVEGQAATSVIVTLAVTAEEARSIVFAREFGSVWLSNQPDGVDDPLPGVLTREGLGE